MGETPPVSSGSYHVLLQGLILGRLWKMTCLSGGSWKVAGLEPLTNAKLRAPAPKRRSHSGRHFPTVFQYNPEPPSQHRRRLFISAGTFLAPGFADNCLVIIQPARAEENGSGAEDKDEGLLRGILSLFDPNEKTKSGRILPKDYLKSAREVVKSLRESLKEDSNDNAKFRRSADSAKESIRNYMQRWTGDKSVASEDSYVALERVIRVLAKFYSKEGPTASLPEDIKSKVMNDLNLADDAL